MELRGVDLSQSNGIVDFDKMKASGIQFVMIRCGYGSDIPSQDDKQFERNVREAERVGIPWGTYLYSYALTSEQAHSELEHIKRLLKGKNPAYPVAFDMEDADHYKLKHGMPNNSTLVDICEIVLSGIEELGHYAMLYASESWLDGKLKSPRLDRFDKWLAEWRSKPTYKGKHSLWQYTNSGTVPGIKGRVDMNISYYDFAPKKEEKPVTEGPFKDIPVGFWAEPSIASLKAKGIFEGHTDGTFKPDDVLTRAQAAVVIDKLLKYLGK